MRRSVAIAFLIASTFCWGQAGTPVSAPASSPEKNNQQPEKVSPDKAVKDKSASVETKQAADEYIPAYTLQIHEQEKPIGGFVASPLIQSPVRCSSDGTPFFNMIDFPNSKGGYFDPFKQTVYSVSSKGAQSYPIKNLPDLGYVRFVALDADDSKVVLLVTGTPKDLDGSSSGSSAQLIWVPRKPNQDDAASSEPPESPERLQELKEEQKFAKGKNYLVFFDRDGSYKKSAKLGVEYHPHDIALLSSGELVVFGYDEVNSVVRISLLDSDGGFLHDISYSDDLTSDPSLQATKTGTVIERLRALSNSGFGSWHFARARGKVLLYQPDSKAPVLEIGPGGVRREVPLSLPKGYYLKEFLPSSDRWIVMLGENGPNKPARNVAGTFYEDFALFELNPIDGTPRYRINMGGEIPFNAQSIACEQDGRFLAYKTDENSKFTLLNADITR